MISSICGAGGSYKIQQQQPKKYEYINIVIRVLE